MKTKKPNKVRFSNLFYSIILTLLIVIIGLYSINKAGSINQRANNIFTQELKPLETIEDIKASMYRIRERVGRHILEPERQVIHQEKIEEQLARMTKNKASYHQSRLSSIEIELINKMESSWQYYIDIIQNKVLPLSSQGKQEQAEDILYGPALNAFRKARQALNSLSDYQIQRAERRQNSAQHAYMSILQLVLAVIISSILLTIFLIIRYKHSEKAKKYRDLIIRNTAQGLMIVDKNLKITTINKAFETITGYSEQDVLGKTPAILSSGHHDISFYKKMWFSIKKNGSWEGEIWNKHKNGNIYPEWLSIIAFRSSNGSIDSYIGTFIDISKLKATEEKVKKLAYYDPLTDLGNNNFLKKELSHLIKATKKNTLQIGLILFDIAHFNDINASLGRKGGNELIIKVAQLLKSRAPKDSIITRHDNDRFIVTIKTNLLGFEYLESKIIGFINDIQNNSNFFICNSSNSIKINWSVGITCYPKDAIKANQLIENVNIALLHNKAQNSLINYTFYREEFSEKINYQYQLSLGIDNAIENSELSLVFQPQVTKEGDINGAEVLLRWHSKKFGIIPPDIFIALAEENGAINKIGRWVLDSTLEEIKKWQKKCSKTSECFKRIAINVSPHQIISSTIAQEYAKACQTMGINNNLIEIEITETGMMNFSENIIIRLQQLAEKGFSLAIDDFGTGYSSLGRLQHFPIDVLKIDRIFIKQIISNPAQAAIVKYIINMAHTLGMEVIAEGVETKAEVDMLTDFNCDIFQGYYFAKPLASDEFIEYITSQTAQKLLKES